MTFYKKSLAATALVVGLTAFGSNSWAQDNPVLFNTTNASDNVIESESNYLSTGFVTSLSGEAVYFPMKKGDPKRAEGKIAPGVAFNMGYRTQSFNIMAGITYFLRDFYGVNDILLQGTVHYFFNVPLGSSSAFSIGVGGGVAHNFLGAYIDKISDTRNKLKNNNNQNKAKKVKRTPLFFAVVDAPIKLSFGTVAIGIAPKLYIPIMKDIDIGYGVAADVDLIF